MRKLSFAVAVVMALGGAGLAGSASAAPGAPMGVSEAAPDTVTSVRHRRGMRHRHYHHRHYGHRMYRHHHRRSLKRRVIRGVLRNL